MTWGQAWEDPLTRHQATLMFHVTTNPKLNGIQRVHNTVPPGPARLLKLSCVTTCPTRAVGATPGLHYCLLRPDHTQGTVILQTASGRTPVRST